MKKEKTQKVTKFTHLSKEERFFIGMSYKAGATVRGIADTLHRSPNTISYEVRKNSVKGVYDWKKADHKAYYGRWKSKRTCLKVSMDKFLDRFVREKLVLKWSPKSISGYLKEHMNIIVSAKAIYRYIESRNLEQYLFWSWNKHKTGPKVSKIPQNNDNRKRIDQRPVVSESGHYEVDFIVSKHNSVVLLVVVDILTKYTRMRILPNRKRTTISSAFAEVFNGVSVQSITTDNDIAFQHWSELEIIIQAPIYFCYPYHSWEKGLVENTNRWIRCFVPKKKDIALVTQSEMDNIHAYLNDRPRGCIDYMIPSEYYCEMNSVLIGG